MTTTLQKKIEELTTHRASEWLQALKSDEEAQHQAFIRWIGESPRHLDEFLAMVALDRELPRLDFKSRFNLQALLADVSPPVTDLDAAHMRPTPLVAARSRRAWRWTAVAAGLALCTVSFMFVRGELSRHQGYETALGEQRSIELPDGSLMTMNAQSRIQVQFSGAARELRLLRGEASFKVAHETARPFRVSTPDALVQALGTEFNVYARPEGTTVSVLEGKVQVSSGKAPVAPPAALGAGETARIGSTGGIELSNAPTDIERATVWRQRRLVFDKTPLEEVVREFNRYNRSPQLRLESIAPGTRHYSGNFDADDPESLGAFLAREPDLSIDKQNGEIVIRRR